MNRLSSRNQLIIAGVLVVVVSAAVIVFGIMPLFQEASSLDAQLADADAQLQTANSLVERRLSAKARAADNEVELMMIANQMPEAPELPSVIVELQDTANATGLEFVQITPAELEDSEAGTYKVMPMSVVMQGEWSDIIEFIRKVDKLTRGVRTRSGTFSRETTTEEDGTEESFINANITLEVYVMNPIQPGAVAPAAE